MEIFQNIIKIAKSIIAMDFPTKESLDKYLKEHPKADINNHRVVVLNKNTGTIDFPALKKENKRNTIRMNRSVSNELGISEKEGMKIFDKMGIREEAIVSRMSKRGILQKFKNKSGFNGVHVLDSARAICRYTGGMAAFDINKSLREGEKVPDADLINDFIKFGPRNSKDNLYRGMALTAAELKDLGITKGKELEEKGFLSTSQSLGVAIGFMKNNLTSKGKVPLIFHFENTKWKGMSLAPLKGGRGMEVSSNHEVLFKSGTRIRIKSLKVKDFEDYSGLHKNRRFKQEEYFPAKKLIFISAEISDVSNNNFGEPVLEQANDAQKERLSEKVF